MSRADRFIRLPRSEYPAHVAAAIAIANDTQFRHTARVQALAVLRAYNPDNIPLRPAVVAELDAGTDRAE